MILKYLFIGLDTKEAKFRRFQKKVINPLAGTQKVRKLNDPNEEMRRIHQRLIGLVRNFRIKLPYSTAMLPGCQPLKNVLRHRYNRYFYLTDLKSCYPNMKPDQVKKSLLLAQPILAKEEKLLDEIIHRYCFLRKGGLIQGAPSSPDIANLTIGLLIDGKLAELCQKYQITYTRYLDDLTFSSNQVIGKKKRKALRQIILDAGFQISHKKSVVHDLKKGILVITGIGLRYGGETFLTRKFLRTIRGMLNLYLRNKVSAKGAHLSPRNRKRIVVTPGKIAGRMGCFFSSIESKEHTFNQTEKKLLEKYQQFRRLAFPQKEILKMKAEVIWKQLSLF